MIRSFKDKLKKKQEAYEAKQQVLAEQAEQARIKHEWELFDLEQEKIKQRTQLILAEEESRQHAEYIEWKREQRLLQEQLDQQPAEKINTGVGAGHESTWRLTWKSFSTHPNIIDLPMSEKIRLYRLAEQQQVDRLNYYANLHSQQNSLGSGPPYGTATYFLDGVVDATDNISVISEDTTWPNSVDVNVPLTINAGVTLVILGVMTVNAAIINNGTINASQGFIVNSGNIDNTNGTLIVP